MCLFRIYYCIFISAYLALLSSCARGCENKYDQEQLDKMYMTQFYPGAIPDFDPTLNSKISEQKNCRYLTGDAISKKVFSSFEFIRDTQYLLYSCSYDMFTEVIALPKYLEGYYDEFKDGTCTPKFNPLALRSYRIELEAKTNEIVELRRMVD